MNEEQIAIEQMLTGIIEKGNQALDTLDSIAPTANEFSSNLLKKLLDKNKDTVYGKTYHFSEIKTYEEYKQKVPLTTFADYEKLVARISENGESNILFSEPIAHFCPTTGTTSLPKLIPVVKEGLELATVYTLPAALAMGDRELKKQGKSGFVKEKGLFLVEIGNLSHSKSGITIGGICSTSVRASNNLLETLAVSPREIITPDAYLDSKYLHLLFALQEPNLSWIGSGYMTTVSGVMDCMATNWEKLCDDIENGSINPEIEMSAATRVALNSKLTPNPVRANELRAIFAQGFDEPIVPKIWPKLSFIGAIGSGSFKIHTEKVRRFVGSDVPICNLVIAASESMVAVADGCNTEDFILIPQAAFFEFIPEKANSEDEIYTMDQLKVGERYEIVVTTLSGLYRYRMMDVVEVTGFYGEIPKVRFSHRSNVFLNIAGEKTTGADLSRAINTFSEKTGIRINEYVAYADMQDAPGCYAVLLEPDNEMDINKIQEYTEILEEAFMQTFGYKYERASGNINPLKLYIQQKQTHLFYRELQIMKGASPNQLKPVRIIKTPDKIAFFMKMIEK